MPLPAVATTRPNLSSRTIWSMTGAAFGAAVLLDITADAFGGAQASHMAIELVLMGAVLAGGSWVGRRWQRYQASIERALSEAEASLAQWKDTAARLQTEAISLKNEATSLRCRTADLKNEAAALRAEVERRPKANVTGLSAVIETQFGQWELSPAEAEVAMLLLKGLSLKETADVRGTSERTTRKQARAVYRKSGLAGRAELSAWFLEDLLVDDGSADTVLTE